MKKFKQEIIASGVGDCKKGNYDSGLLWREHGEVDSVWGRQLAID